MIEVIPFVSRTLGRPVEFAVLPPGRLTDDGRCFTLFLLHGMGGDHLRWPTRTALLDLVRDLPLLVVCPSVGESFYLNSDLGAYEDYVAHELVAWADAHFPTIPQASARAIGGYSMGGYGALLLALRNPDVFGAAFSHSGAVLTARATTEVGRPWELADTLYGVGPAGARKRRDHDILSLAARHLREDDAAGKMAYGGPALFLDCGTEDFLYYASRELTQAMRMLGVPYEYHEYPGDHDWSYWDRHVQDSLRFHCRKWGIAL